MMIPTWLIRNIEDTIDNNPKYTTKYDFNHNHIAFIFRGRKLIAVGQNKIGTRSHGCGNNRFTVHAEVDAIRTVGDVSKLKGTTLVVIRVGSQGFLNSKPCKACSCVIEKCMKSYGMRTCLHS